MYALAVSPVVRKEDARVCMRSWLRPWWGGKDACVYIWKRSWTPVVCVGGNGTCLYVFAASPEVGVEDVSACTRSRLPPWWGKRNHVCLWLRPWLSPVVGGRGSTCVYAFALPPWWGIGRMYVYALTSFPVVGERTRGCTWKCFWLYPVVGGRGPTCGYVFAASPVVGGGVNVCVCILSFPRGGGKGRMYVYVEAFVDPFVVGGRGPTCVYAFAASLGAGMMAHVLLMGEMFISPKKRLAAAGDGRLRRRRQGPLRDGRREL